MSLRVGFYRDERGDYRLVGQSRPPELLQREFPFTTASFAPAGGADFELTLGEHISPSPADPALIGTRRVHVLMLYNARDDEEILAFDRRITDEFTEYYAAHGEHYLGVWRTQAPGGLTLAEIYVFDKPLAEAQSTPAGKPARIAAIEDECRALQDADSPKFYLWLDPA
jgi:hypothetical protein